MRLTVCRGRWALLWIALAVLPFWAAQRAQATDLALQDAASMAGTAMFLNSGAPGLIIAVVHGDDSFIAGFGETAPGNKTEPDGKSIFRLGSISKVFAGDLLARMAADGRIGLTDPLSRFAPEGAPLKAFANQPITLLDLATHAAGLPRELRDPTGRSEEGSDVFFASRPDDAWNWLRQQAPAYAPGTTAIYSNYGFGLLGEALAKAGGKPFGALLQAEITAPLGLGDTVTALSEQQKPRLMIGLDPFDKPDPNLDVPPVTIASAGVYSTAEDMVRWMRWHVTPASESAATLALAHALWRPHDGLKRLVGVEAGDAAGMGLGWVVTPARGRVPYLIGKSGGLGGFMTYVVLSPNRRLGILVMASRVNFGMFEGLRAGVRTLAAELAPASE